jgi:hypothetical protein
MHVEKWGNTEVEGIEHGTCFVFPKVDGTNASVWLGSRIVHASVQDLGDPAFTPVKIPAIQAGSRTRHLSLESDNAGFFAWVLQQPNLTAYLLEHPTHRLHGEWLVPHTLKTYREDAWKRFWIFDIEVDGTFLSYDAYNEDLQKHGLDFIVPMFKAENIHFEYLLKALEKNTFLIREDSGLGEGVVVKNYDFVNKYGNTIWAKVVRQEFKEDNAKVFGINNIGLATPVEKLTVDKFVTEAMVDKVYAKIVNETGGWESKLIPRLLNTVFYDLIREEMWEVLKEFNNPTISFQSLKAYTIQRVKTLKKELF